MYRALLIILIFIVVAHAGTRVFMSISSTVAPVGPPYNITLASTANMTNTTHPLANEDFYSSPDAWLCARTANLSCVWVSSDAGSSGGAVRINGTVPAGARDYALVYQSAVLPSDELRSVVVYARVRASSAPIIGVLYYLVGVAYTNGTIIQYASGTVSSSYVWVSVNVTRNVSAGGEYLWFAGAYASSYLISGSVDFYIDAVVLVVETRNYTFTDTVALADASGNRTYNISVIIESVECANGTLSAQITISNLTATSTPATIRNCTVETRETSKLRITAPPSGYHSARIVLSASTASANAEFTIHYYIVVETSDEIRMYSSTNITLRS